MSDTKKQILDIAENLTQQRGFGGFSYLDLAERIGIKTASIHYHFRCKDDLAAALVERSKDVNNKQFEELESRVKSPKKRLETLIEHFQGYVVNKKFCLCGMMAAELHSVSPRVGKLLNEYFEEFHAWLTKHFKAMKVKNPRNHALRFLSAAEGALLLARLRDDPQIIHDVLKDFLKG